MRRLGSSAPEQEPRRVQCLAGQTAGPARGGLRAGVVDLRGEDALLEAVEDDDVHGAAQPVSKRRLHLPPGDTDSGGVCRPWARCAPVALPWSRAGFSSMCFDVGPLLDSFG